MRISKEVALTTMAFVLLLLANVARAQTPTATDPPVWTNILTNTVANTGVMNMASGNYFAFSDPASSSTTIPGTDLQGIGYTLALASNLTTLAPATSYTLPTFKCGTGNSAVSIPETPVTFIESFSSSGSGGIFGIGFEGTFNSPSAAVSDVNSIFEAVFFNENQCYGKNGLGGGDESNANGREYGFFLDTYNNTIWAYWGTLENVDTAQVQVELTTCSAGPGECTCNSGITGSACTAPSGSGTAKSVSCSSGLSSCSLGTNMQTVANGAASPVAGGEYFYEIYPFTTTAGSPANCSFQINVFSSNNTVTPIYTATIPVNGGPTANSVGITGIVTTPTTITTADASFCSVIASSSGDTGFASANVNPGGATTGTGVTLPPPSQMNVYIDRLFVGKE